MARAAPTQRSDREFHPPLASARCARCRSHMKASGSRACATRHRRGHRGLPDLHRRRHAAARSLRRGSPPAGAPGLLHAGRARARGCGADRAADRRSAHAARSRPRAGWVCCAASIYSGHARWPPPRGWLANRFIAVKGCNQAFWRDDLVRVNGFNEAIEGWGPEDKELCARLVECRRRTPDPAVRRHRRPPAPPARLTRRLARQPASSRARQCRGRRTWCDRGLDSHLARLVARRRASPAREPTGAATRPLNMSPPIRRRACPAN